MHKDSVIEDIFLKVERLAGSVAGDNSQDGSVEQLQPYVAIGQREIEVPVLQVSTTQLEVEQTAVPIEQSLANQPVVDINTCREASQRWRKGR